MAIKKKYAYCINCRKTIPNPKKKPLESIHYQVLLVASLATFGIALGVFIIYRKLIQKRKYCPHCKQWLYTDEFYKRNDAKDKLRSWCKMCIISYNTHKYNTDTEYHKKQNLNTLRYAKRNNYRHQKNYIDKHKRKLINISLMDNPFPDDVDIELHHINDLLTIPIPKITHKHFQTGDRSIHRMECNSFIKKINLY